MNINWPQFLLQIAPWGLPLGIGLVILVVGPFLKKHHSFSFSFSLIGTLLSLWLAFESWRSASGDHAGLFLFDSFTYLFVLFFLLALLFTLFLSFQYLENFGLVRPEYYALLLFSVFGMGCMAAGHDLMVVFLGLEIMSVSVYVLAGFRRSNQLCVEAALKYFLIGAFASAFLLLGIAFLYGATGTTDLLVFHQKGTEIFSGDSRVFALVGLSLVAVGLGFKIAVVPFHFWAADVYEGAPLVVTNFMATAVKAAGFAALLRVVWALFQWEPEFLSNIIWIASVLTMTVGNVAALVQKNLKRMLAYSSIAHAGYALIPLVAYASQSDAVISSISFYLLTYILMTTGAFAVLIALTNQVGGKEVCDVRDLAGLGYQKPFLGFAMTVLMLSLAGIPPTMGFFGKYYLFLQAVQVGQIWLVVLAVINSVISVYYYLSPVVAIYFSPATAEQKLPYGARHPVVNFVVVITLVSILLFGLFPNPLIDFVRF